MAAQMEHEHTELKHASVLFTEEAEAALRKELSRAERRLRTRSMDEASRLRGWPPEVTGSDVTKAARDLSIGTLNFDEFPRSKFDSRERAELLHRHLLASLEKDHSLKKRSRSLTFADMLAKTYAVIGVIFAIGGMLYAPLYEAFLKLTRDPYWKRGLIITAAGIVLFLMSMTFRAWQSRLVRLRHHQPDVNERIATF